MAHQQPLIDGEKVPSVTGIVGMKRKIYLEFWRGKYGNKECARVMKESQQFGSVVHQAIDVGLKDKFFNIKLPMPKLNQRQEVMLATFWSWQAESRFTPLKTEYHVINKEYRYGGTFDVIGYFGDDTYIKFILDWKCSSQLDWDYGLQLCGYSAAYESMTSEFIDQGGIIRLEKKPDKFPQIEIQTFNKLKAHHWPAFAGLLEVHKHDKLGAKHDPKECPICLS